MKTIKMLPIILATLSSAGCVGTMANKNNIDSQKNKVESTNDLNIGGHREMESGHNTNDLLNQAQQAQTTETPEPSSEEVTSDTDGNGTEEPGEPQQEYHGTNDQSTSAPLTTLNLAKLEEAVKNKDLNGLILMAETARTELEKNLESNTTAKDKADIYTCIGNIDNKLKGLNTAHTGDASADSKELSMKNMSEQLKKAKKLLETLPKAKESLETTAETTVIQWFKETFAKKPKESQISVETEPIMEA
jgi:hypothetical protein